MLSLSSLGYSSALTKPLSLTNFGMFHCLAITFRLLLRLCRIPWNHLVHLVNSVYNFTAKFVFTTMFIADLAFEQCIPYLSCTTSTDLPQCLVSCLTSARASNVEYIFLEEAQSSSYLVRSIVHTTSRTHAPVSYLRHNVCIIIYLSFIARAAN